MPSLSITSIAPYFMIMALCFLVADKLSWLIHERYYSVNFAQRHQAINGIRSILAMSVFFHHAVITYFFYQNGRWENPPSHFFTLVGEVSVGVFFAITGFLFWEKAINSRGMISYKSFLLSRIKRIAPAYLVAASLILLIVAWQSGMILKVPLEELLRRTASLMFGLGLLSNHPINNIDPNQIGARVFWTLKYEWRFYLALPLLAILLRNKTVMNIAFIALGIGLVYKMISSYSEMPLSTLFLTGIFAAQIHANTAIREKLSNSRLLPGVGLAALITIFLFFDSMYGYGAVLCVFVFFVSLVHLQPGNHLYAFLQSRPARLLGAVSYSTYILHSIILYLFFSVINRYYPVQQMQPILFWSITASIAIFLVIASALSYKYVEYPFLKKRI